MAEKLKFKETNLTRVCRSIGRKLYGSSEVHKRKSEEMVVIFPKLIYMLHAFPLEYQKNWEQGGGGWF